MLEDGNCLFRSVADQVYGDSEAYDLTRQMCIDYMVRVFMIYVYVCLVHCACLLEDIGLGNAFHFRILV